jgi:hypothetical protein
MRGSGGKFFPRAQLTTAESIAMLARMRKDTMPSLLSGQTRYYHYTSYVQTHTIFGYLGVVPSINETTPITRKELIAAMAWYSTQVKYHTTKRLAESQTMFFMFAIIKRACISSWYQYADS